MRRATGITGCAASEGGVRAWELDGILDVPGIKLLSLDCFDTILWRQTDAPIDVFFDLQSSPPFAARELDGRQRVLAETQARQTKVVRDKRAEVTLAEIYRAAFPQLDQDELAALAAAELAAEKVACQAFPPVVELMRQANARGLGIAVVSDTYFSEAQLRELLQHCLPADVYAAIGHVVVSSAHGYSKADGLFAKVLPSWRVKAPQVLHLGDNPGADLHPPRKLGMHARQLVHHGEGTAETLRLQSTAASMLLPELRNTRSMPSPFRAVWAQAPEQTGGDFLGYLGAGPILYSFARFILDEIAAARAEGKRVKPLFLMRDGYLPQKVCDAIAGEPVGYAAAISRRVAYAASFRSARDIEFYLSRFASPDHVDVMARQLMLEPQEAQQLAAVVGRAQNRGGAMVDWLLRPPMVKAIVERSRQARQRLYKYLERVCGLEAGDTLMFIDLGYEGTAQRQLEPVFRDEKQIEVLGRYLLAAPIPDGHRSRKGLIDDRWCDPRAISTLVRHIAVVENICTNDEGSVTGYDADGNPQKGKVLIERPQLQKLEAVQTRCVQFARDAEKLYAASGKRPTASALRDACVAALGRLIFLPSETEVEFLAGFRLDLNLASDDTAALFDREAALTGLKQRGLFFIETTGEKMRLNYPTELRTTGLELSLTMMGLSRFELGFSPQDLTHRRETVDVMLARDGKPQMLQLQAQATYDGCYALLVPVGSCNTQVGLSFGRRYEWLQLEDAQLVRTNELYGERESKYTTDVRGQLLPQGMSERAPGLWECSGADSFLFFAPPPAKKEDDAKYVLRVVFRPVARRRLAAVKAA